MTGLPLTNDSAPPIPGPGKIVHRSRAFSLDDNEKFAELSGDYNPLHVDQIAARRFLFGEPVVHGVHSALWALDEWARASMSGPVELKSLRCVFRRPIKLNEEVRCVIASDDPLQADIEIFARGEVATIVRAEWACRVPDADNAIDDRIPEKIVPRVRSREDIADASGQLDLCLPRDATDRLFPHLTNAVAPAAIAAILATTRLVGVECPGFHSIFSQLRLVETDDCDVSTMAYEVTRCDARFGLATMKVKAAGMQGVIEAFLRPAPRSQPSCAEIKNHVVTGEFAGQRALVIGGSRGLGEVTAKILGIGGADVIITYYQGNDDAGRVVDDIVSNGGTASCVQCDILGNAENLTSELDPRWQPTHLYYFATPAIFSAEKGTFSAELFQKFCDYYVRGFLSVLKSFKPAGPLRIYYPSSVALVQLPTDMGEYAAAKAAGETLCQFLEKSEKNITIYRPRLPRMATDQTASVVPIDSEDPIATMLEQLRIFNEL